MCSHEFGVSAVLSALFEVTSFRPCAAGCWAPSRCSVASAPPAAASVVIPAARMNSRRLRHTFLSVMCELEILSMKVHLGVHPYFHRVAILHRGSESPLLERSDGALITFSVQG